MKYFIVLSLALLTACASVHQQNPQSSNTPQQITNASVLILFFDKDKKDHVLSAIKQKGDELVYEYKNMNGVAIKVDDKEKSILYYQQIDGVLQVNENQFSQLH